VKTGNSYLSRRYNQQILMGDKFDDGEDVVIFGVPESTSKGFAEPQTAVKRVAGEGLLQRLAKRGEVERDPRRRIQEAIVAGVDTVALPKPDGGFRDVPIAEAMRSYGYSPKQIEEVTGLKRLLGKERVVPAQAPAWVRAQANLAAIADAQSGVPLEDQPKWRTELLDATTIAQVKQISEDRAKQLRAPWMKKTEKVLKEAGTDAELAVIEAGALAGKGVAGVSKYAEGGLKEAGPAGTAAEGEKTLVELNPLLSDRGKGQFRPLKDVEGTESLQSSFEDLLGKRVGGAQVPRKSENAYIEEEVSELHRARDRMAKVDLSPFEKGEDAFKKGDREGLIKSINELETQEQLLADRWNLVEQTRATVLSPKHRVLAYAQDDGMFGGLLGGGGGDKLAERTQKVAEVKRRIKDSSNELYARRKLLRYKLQRMDATVAPETSLPSERVQVLEKDSSTLPYIPKEVSPRSVLEEVFWKKPQTPAPAVPVQPQTGV
jgi:hypothetical protein